MVIVTTNTAKRNILPQKSIIKTKLNKLLSVILNKNFVLKDRSKKIISNNKRYIKILNKN
jgi:hypothetical protein